VKVRLTENDASKSEVVWILVDYRTSHHY